MIARESRGSPFFVYELVEHLLAGGELEDRSSIRGSISLDDVLWGGSQRLPEAPGAAGGAGRRRPAAPPGRHDPRGRAGSRGLLGAGVVAGQPFGPRHRRRRPRRRRDLPRPDPRDGRQPSRGRAAEGLARAAGRHAGGLRARRRPGAGGALRRRRPAGEGRRVLRPRGAGGVAGPGLRPRGAAFPPGNGIEPGRRARSTPCTASWPGRWPTPAGHSKRRRNTPAPARPPAPTRSRSCGGPWRSSSS